MISTDLRPLPCATAQRLRGVLEAAGRATGNPTSIDYAGAAGIAGAMFEGLAQYLRYPSDSPGRDLQAIRNYLRRNCPFFKEFMAEPYNDSDFLPRRSHGENGNEDHA